jgi:hypothetical protein
MKFVKFRSTITGSRSSRRLPGFLCHWRIIYIETAAEVEVLLLDIGTHYQVCGE